jgi:hypothetical protein
MFSLALEHLLVYTKYRAAPRKSLTVKRRKKILFWSRDSSSSFFSGSGFVLIKKVTPADN